MTRSHLAILLVAAATLAGCTGIDEMTSNQAPRHYQAGYIVPVEPGDTVGSVAQRFNVSESAVIQANHLNPPYGLESRLSLLIPPPSTYRVHAGDTVRGIANILGVDAGELASANGMQPPYQMHVGQILRVPGGVGGEGEPGASAEMAVASGPAITPHTAISSQPLAPPTGFATAGTGSFGPAAAAPQPAYSSPRMAQPLSTSATALAPPQTGPQSPPSTSQAAPVPIVPRTPAPAAGPSPEAVAQPAQPTETAMVSPAQGGIPHFLHPVAGQVIQGFGPNGSGQMNDGINIAASAGTPVHAADAGTVIYTGNELPAFGNLVLIRHGGGWVTAYGHLASISVQRGATVTSGQTIGTVGQTGSVTSPQLHFEVRQGSKPVDPAPFLSGRG